MLVYEFAADIVLTPLLSGRASSPTGRTQLVVVKEGRENRSADDEDDPSQVRVDSEGGPTVGGSPAASHDEGLSTSRASCRHRRRQQLPTARPHAANRERNCGKAAASTAPTGRTKLVTTMDTSVNSVAALSSSRWLPLKVTLNRAVARPHSTDTDNSDTWRQHSSSSSSSSTQNEHGSRGELRQGPPPLHSGRQTVHLTPTVIPDTPLAFGSPSVSETVGTPCAPPSLPDTPSS